LFKLPETSNFSMNNYFHCLPDPQDLEESYSRCRLMGLPVELSNPKKIISSETLSPIIISNAHLINTVGCIIDSTILPEIKECIFILCNPDLVALKIFAHPDVLDSAEKSGMKPGTVFTEESCGTNALCLAKKHCKVVAIKSQDHYCNLFRHICCAASPVRDAAGNIPTFPYQHITR